jgi:NitT/TauT family transport system substrate-binding protein
MLTRRAFLTGTLAALATSACGRPGGTPGVLRIGFLPNLTYSPILAGLASGRIQKALAPTRIETRVFRAGPRVVEALVGNAIDIGVSGPAPIVFTHARHGAGMLRILSGVASGGASFVVTKKSGIRGPDDLHGKQLAVVQIGATQDIALRTYLREHGIKDAKLSAFGGPTVKLQMNRGDLHGAWMPEPWASRLVAEADGVRLVDERDLWPNRQFAAAVVVGRGDFVRARPVETDLFVRAVHDEIARANASPAETEDATYAEIKRLIVNAGPRATFHEGTKFVEFTADPLAESIRQVAADAHALGLMPTCDCGPLFANA